MSLVELLYSHEMLELSFRHRLWAVRILSLSITRLPRVKARPAEVHVVFCLGRKLTLGAHGCSVCRTLVEEMVAVASGTAGGDDGGAAGRPLTKAQPGHRSYNLQERRRIGSMTGVEQALLPRVPTDESEAQTLATADLDLMKSECCWGLWQSHHW